MTAISFLRALMVGFLLSLSGVTFTCLATKIVSPLCIMRRQREEIDALGAHKRRLAAECIQNERLAHYLSKAEGTELQVRQMGWVKPGERPLRPKDSSWPPASGPGDAAPPDTQR
jgi:hypothetical protein